MGLTLSLATLLERQRIYLDDVDDAEWSDNQLVLFLNDAITLFTTQVPYSKSVDVDVSGQSYDYPDDLVAVERVWGYFTNATIKEFISTGDIEDGAWETNAEPTIVVTGFPSEGQYYFPYQPQGSQFTLMYWAFKSAGFVVDTPGTTVDFGSRPWAEMAVRNLTGFLAFSPGSSFRALLEQWADKQDLNVDNPLEQEARRYMKEYMRILSLYTAQGALVYG